RTRGGSSGWMRDLSQSAWLGQRQAAEASRGVHGMPGMSHRCRQFRPPRGSDSRANVDAQYGRPQVSELHDLPYAYSWIEYGLVLLPMRIGFNVGQVANLRRVVNPPARGRLAIG